MIETIVVLSIVWLILCAVSGRPDDRNPEPPARCFRPYGCRWPDCTCHQHQNQGVQS